MSEDQHNEIFSRIASLETRISDDRKHNRIMAQYQNDELSEIKSLLMQYLANSEADRLQILSLNQKNENLLETRKLLLEKYDSFVTKFEKKDTELEGSVSKVNKEFTEYKKKMKPWELKQDLKRIPYLFFMATWFIMAYGYLKIVFKFLFKKYFGIDL